MICWSADSIKTKVLEVKTWRYEFGGSKDLEGIDGFSRDWEWAMITIDEKGMFAAVSDYDDYVFHWSHTPKGQDIRQFLINAIGNPQKRFPEYVMSKLAKEDHLDVAATVRHIKEHIINERKYSDWTKEQARQEWDYIKDAEDKSDIDHWQEMTEIFDAWEYPVYTFEPMAQNFGRYILPRLQEVLIEQLEKEKQAA